MTATGRRRYSCLHSGLMAILTMGGEHTPELIVGMALKIRRIKRAHRLYSRRRR